ncbi:ABC transporter permease [Lacrimispora sp.]|uniref:ABC transporter permease n=1 Tax=Lacrimispora sp. TaxID=2719234 RepID=UPI0039E5E15B
MQKVPVLKPVVNFVKHNMATIIAFFVMSLGLAIKSPAFLNVDNMVNVLRQVSINAILAIGITYTLITIGVDLSIGSTVAMSGVLAVAMSSSLGVNVWVAILCGILLGAIAGFFNGFVISRTGMPPFIVTLATQLSIRGIAYVITGGKPITSTDNVLNYIGNGYLFNIPVPVIIMAVVAAVAAVILNKTKFGRHMYATGGNKEAAIYSGINVKNVQLSVYVICGILAAISGIILAARLYSGQPTVGVGYEGDAVAATVVGGTSFSGGVGTIGGVMLGSLVIGVLNNGMNLLKIPYYYQLVVKGLVILLAVYIDTAKKKKS